MELRRTIEKDIDNVMKIIKKSQAYFKSQGIDQWQNNYPNPQVIQNDINNNHGYVLVKGNEIIATIAISFDGESTYEEIHEGKWLSENDYAVIHRVAVDDNYKGLGIGSNIISEVEKLCLEKDIKSIKVDTHEENKSMQRLLEKCGFKYCGIIYLEDGDKRIAFEKTL